MITKTKDETQQTDNSADIVLRAESISKSFGGQHVLCEVGLELRRGEVVLLEGENGSGKTTLINILTGNLMPEKGTISYTANSQQIKFSFPQLWLSRFNPINRFAADTVARYGFGRTWQDVRLFDSMSLSDNIAVADPKQRGENPLFSLLSFASRSSSDSAAKDSLNQLGLSGREESSGDMISLGQSKRVAIARAVAAGARVLFLDEPLAGLDRQGIDDVLELLSDLVKKHDVTLVIVEHLFNQSHLKNLITSHWHLENGKLTVSGKVKSNGTFEQPHWFQMLVDAADEVITEPLPRGAKLTRFRIVDRYKDKPVLEIKNLIVKRGNRTVIGLDDGGAETGFNLTINQGEIAILQAPNGWGKSTLLESVCGLVGSSNGKIRVGKTAIQDFAVHEINALGVNYLQSNSQLFPSFTTLEIFQLGTIPISNEDARLIGKAVANLSGGEKQRIAISVLSPESNLTLLDEPFNGLDGVAANKVLDSLLEFPNALLATVPYIIG